MSNRRHPPGLAHIHADPYDEVSLGEALAGTSWDVIVAMYGRLRMIAQLTKGMCDHFVSVGGVPAYRGWTGRLAARSARPAGAGTGGRPSRRRPCDRREGLPHRAHRSSGVQRPTRGRRTFATPTSRALPTGTPGMVGRAARSRREAIDHCGRRGAHPPPSLLHRELCPRHDPHHRATPNSFPA